MVQSSVLEGGLPDLSILGHWRREGFDPYAIVKRPHVCRSSFADNASIHVHPQRNSRALKRTIFLELAENTDFSGYSCRSTTSIADLTSGQTCIEIG
jgi:hypothetical protein